MSALKIAMPFELFENFIVSYEVIDIRKTDFTDVAAAVTTTKDIKKIVDKIADTGFNIPIFLALYSDELIPDGVLPKLTGVFQLGAGNRHYYGKQLAASADNYIENLYPPFFKELHSYVSRGYVEFDCPGHQGGQFFTQHPLGRQFFNFYGETLFRSDLCNADVKLGDLLIHEGAAAEAQKNAARIYNADKTYFVLNGTSTSNKVVTSALLAKDDIVLFDRNNHKSVHLGALVLSGALPIYMETARNNYGFIGGIDAHCFNETYIREAIREVCPERADLERPIRLAVIQLGTYDGTIYNARQVIDKIGHLCDYILFDSAWVGYEQFIPMMEDSSPLLLSLTEKDPGIFVTQSVHKQQAGFSQTSQIHKKDKHIKGQHRYCSHKRLNNAYMMHASTSPFYPLFAALDVNAQMHKGVAGKRLWRECVKNGVEARKLLLNSCKYIKPFVPDFVDGKRWQDYPTEMIIDDLRFFKFKPGENWHAFEGYTDNQYFIDPCKLLLTTPGINQDTGEYASFGVPASILAHYLRENGVIPEKADLNSILFLLTPSESLGKLQHLIAHIARFEKVLEDRLPIREVLPTLYKNHEKHYFGKNIHDLCQSMHDFYKFNDMKTLQKQMFRKDHFPEQVVTPWEANQELVHNKVELVSLSDIKGRIAAEGALPYPPGVLCVVPGEKWQGPALKYFRALESGLNLLPGFEPELQGVYIQKDVEGVKKAYGYVLKG
ncbi:ornithine decarboxylase (plasmid) [Advenella sp. S44]|uniref:ornithine decarboxylase n=1 Tax=unclassified Advenella TaxID=2685285 RepID=UPI000C2B3E77|nr:MULTISPECIES: ornithine decarboxylase [unclassified Advenella]PJX19955.1 ornithine decarboxylase [Advenella sp. S44]